jgi:hypothetical protein
MGAVAVDVNNVVEISAVGFRALHDALGEYGTQVFIDRYFDKRPRITAAEIAEILERAETKAKELDGTGIGDFTNERHEWPAQSFEEITARLMKAEAERLTKCPV